MRLSFRSALLALAFVMISTPLGLLASRVQAYPYSFDWPGQQYIADDNGNYAYRDLTFPWDYWQSTSPGPSTSIYPTTSYVRIASPYAGYHYDSWGLWIFWNCNYWGSGVDSFYWNTSSWSATYSNTPQTVWVDTWAFPCGNTNVRFGMCDGSDCASAPLGPSMSAHGAWLESALSSWGTSASAWDYQN